MTQLCRLCSDRYLVKIWGISSDVPLLGDATAIRRAKVLLRGTPAPGSSIAPKTDLKKQSKGISMAQAAHYHRLSGVLDGPGGRPACGTNPTFWTSCWNRASDRTGS